MRKPQDLYPAQVTIGDPGFPHGKARNVGTLGDGDGFPFEEKWVNDYLGAIQALLVAAGITPDGTPETALSSQVLSALRYLTEHIQGHLSVGSSMDVHGESEFHSQTEFSALVRMLASFEATSGTVTGALNVGGVLGALHGIAVATGFGIIVQSRGVVMSPSGTGIGTGGDAVLQIDASVQEAIRFSANGRLVRRVQTAPDSDATFSWASGDRIIIPNSVTGGHVYTLDESSAEQGAELRIINWSVHSHTIRSATTPVLIMTPDGGSALPNTWKPSSVDMLYHDNGTGVGSRWFPGPITTGV